MSAGQASCTSCRSRCQPLRRAPSTGLCPVATRTYRYTWLWPDGGAITQAAREQGSASQRVNRRCCQFCRVGCLVRASTRDPRQRRRNTAWVPRHIVVREGPPHDRTGPSGTVGQGDSVASVARRPREGFTAGLRRRRRNRQFRTASPQIVGSVRSADTDPRSPSTTCPCYASPLRSDATSRARLLAVARAVAGRVQSGTGGSARRSAAARFVEAHTGRLKASPVQECPR
jgi:hypothetical protein